MKIPAKHRELISRLRQRGKVQWTGREFRTLCPAHDDHGPSLCVRLMPDQSNTLVHCGAGCPAEAIVAAVDLSMADLFHDGDDLVEMDEADGTEPGTRPRAAGPGWPSPGPSSRVAGPGHFPAMIEPADADLTDEVYGKLLGGLGLIEAHREDLLRRGLNDDEISRRGYRSLRKFEARQAQGRLKGEYADEALLRVPGFRLRNGRVQFVDREGLLVRVYVRQSRIVALKIRADDADEARGRPKYTWASSADQGGPSPGSPPHVPLGTPERADVVRITEGELKADVASVRSGLPTIGVPGVDQWKAALHVLQDMRARVVLVAFDSDAWTKRGVAAALAACVKELIRLGYEVRLETWDPADGKGIDDLLAAGKEPTVVTGQEVLTRLEEIGRSADDEPGDDADDAWFPRDTSAEVADFPVECLPERLRRFVTEAARSLQCPVDFLGMAMLAVASAAIGNSRKLRIRRGYEEGARIFAAIVAKAGSVKSPALRLVCGPVYEQQRRLTALYRQERQQHAADLEEYEHRRRLALKAKEPMPPDLERPARPVSGHVYVENITVEALARVLSQAPRGVLMIRDELTGWVLSLNQYRSGRGADRQVFLSIWSGEPTKIDRKGELDEPLIVADPFVSVIGCIPPAKLAALDDGEDGEDGFIHRIIFAYPRPVTGRSWSWEGVSGETRQLWGDAVEQLYGLEMDRDENGDPVPRVLDLAPEACRSWEDWYNAHVADMESPDLGEALAGPWSKLVAYAARLALILHLLRVACAEGRPDEVDGESLERAFRLVEYLKSHARAVYDQLQRPRKQSRVQRVLAWIRAHDRAEVHPSDLARGQVAGIRTKSEAEVVMREMSDLGYGRLEERRAKNNRKVLWFLTRPGQLGPVGPCWAGKPNSPDAATNSSKKA